MVIFHSYVSLPEGTPCIYTGCIYTVIYMILYIYILYIGVCLRIGYDDHFPAESCNPGVYPIFRYNWWYFMYRWNRSFDFWPLELGVQHPKSNMKTGLPSGSSFFFGFVKHFFVVKIWATHWLSIKLGIYIYTVYMPWGIYPIFLFSARSPEGFIQQLRRESNMAMGISAFKKIMETKMGMCIHIQSYIYIYSVYICMYVYVYTHIYLVGDLEHFFPIYWE